MPREVRKRGKRTGVLIKILILTLLIGFATQHSVPQKIVYPYFYRDTIERYAKEYGVDPLLVVSVIREESKFIPISVSHKGAQGLMQLMPETASWIAAKLGDSSYSLESLRHPEKNIQYGTWYLANLKKEFDDVALIIAAYNGGIGRVKEWLETGKIKSDRFQIEDIPYKETREYVAKVLKSYEKYQALYR